MEQIITKDNLAETVQEIADTVNPAVLSNNLSIMQSSMLRNNLIGLYESYLFNFEIIKIRRLKYVQSGWLLHANYKDCLAILNQYYMAYIFDDSVSAAYLYEWGMEVSRLCDRYYPHYIMDRYEDYFTATKESRLLWKLLEVRKHGDKLKDDDGPYHFEVYPYDYCIPEQMLLEGGIIDIPKTISNELGEIIVALNLR